MSAAPTFYLSLQEKNLHRYWLHYRWRMHGKLLSQCQTQLPELLWPLVSLSECNKGKSSRQSMWCMLSDTNKYQALLITSLNPLAAVSVIIERSTAKWFDSAPPPTADPVLSSFFGSQLRALAATNALRSRARPAKSGSLPTKALFFSSI